MQINDYWECLSLSALCAGSFLKYEGYAWSILALNIYTFSLYLQLLILKY